MSVAEKRALLSQIAEQLAEELRTLVAAQRASQEGAVHEDNRAEGDKDMRATEASYLARGQAMRVAELETAHLRIQQVECADFSKGSPIAVGALVTLRAGHATRVVFLLPAGAGIAVQHRGRKVRVVTPASPLGGALIGAVAGDNIDVEVNDRTDEYDVVSVE